MNIDVDVVQADLIYRGLEALEDQSSQDPALKESYADLYRKLDAIKACFARDSR